MKVLILSISTGQGHHATGQAIQNTFREMGIQCETLDAYEYIKPLLSELVSKGYLISTAYAPKLASKFYDIVVKKNEPVEEYSMTKIANKILAKELKQYIEDSKVDVIICTHVLSATMVNIMIEKHWIDIITVGIITDFTVHPLWEECRNLDYYVTCSELLEYQMKKKGLDTNKMLPFGIPIRPQFYNKTDKEEARKKLGVEKDKQTLLLMSGSMGYGKIDESINLLDNLDLDFQTMVVCGNNKKMLKKVNHIKTKKRFDIYGYVDNVDLMMDAASCIITKPGGITTSETLAKGLPMIMVNPIPGHEMRNAEFMMNNGLAIYATKTFPLDEAVFSLFRHPDRVENLRATIKLYRKQNASNNLCQFLIEKVSQKNL
ncbi:MGDG synthase family glycosyltransferase [Anaerovorax odorimutans]|uniref:MGDG synthase family glycosyltransferase n=1 Tax=Anaerovorax odorimutans TaxID=109327 RepID=UPI0003FC83BB|nr:glycosyltransferase [Anaerovorax odorimutans]